MIEGIEILSQEPIMESSDLGRTIFLIGAGICLVIGILIEALNDNGIGFIIAGFGAFLCLWIGIIIDDSNKMPTGKYEYKVIIDDNVSMAEFYEQYEVIDQDGKIFIVREKDDVDG